MLKALYRSQPVRTDQALTFMRWVTALILLVHPITRLIHHTVPLFGEWLGTQGFSHGTAVAYAVTFTELLCGTLLLVRRGVVAACAGHILILAMGIKMVHAPEGWFVVGGGRNGVEFSVLLIGMLLGLAWAHLPRSSGS